MSNSNGHGNGHIQGNVPCLRCGEQMTMNAPHVCFVEMTLTVKIPMHLKNVIEGAVEELIGVYSNPESAGALIVSIPNGASQDDAMALQHANNVIVDKLRHAIRSRMLAQAATQN